MIRFILIICIILISTIELMSQNCPVIETNVVYQPLVYYDLDTCDRSPSYILSGFVATDISTNTNNGPGCNNQINDGCASGCPSGCSGNKNSFITNNWSNTQDYTKYYEFNIQPQDPTVSFTISSIGLSSWGSNTGPKSLAISLNNTMPPQSISPPNWITTNCQTFTATVGQTFIGSTNIKIFFWGSTGNTGTVRIDNVIVCYSMTTLPVELIGFSGNLEGSWVKLNWQTASENNSSQFEIQRSIDTQEWKSIGQIQSAGNSYNLLEYRFVDSDLPNSEIIYYRLKQVDLDGQFEFSNTIAINQKLNTILVRGDEVTYGGENPELVTIWDLWGRFIGDLSGGSRKLDGGIYFINVGGRVYKIAI